MIIRGFGSSYEINETKDGCYLSNGQGFVMETEEVKKLAEDLIRFAEKNADALAAHNAEQSACYERLFSPNNTKQGKPLKSNRAYVYLFECCGKYKVGISKDPERRRKELDNRPFPVNIIAVSGLVNNAWEYEKEIHSWYECFRIDGEWFDIPSYEVPSIKRIIEEIQEVENDGISH